MLLLSALGDGAAPRALRESSAARPPLLLPSPLMMRVSRV